VESSLSFRRTRSYLRGDRVLQYNDMLQFFGCIFWSAAIWSISSL